MTLTEPWEIDEKPTLIEKNAVRVGHLQSQLKSGLVMNRISKHTGLGLALGAALGTVFGVVAGHIGAWLAIGVAIGMLLGASFWLKEPQCRQCAELHKMHESVRE
jgi:hypothetical protein